VKYNLFSYIQQHGLVDLNCLPYTATNGTCTRKCQNGINWEAAHKCKCEVIEDCSTFDKIKTRLLKGPVSTRIVVYQDFLSYRSEVYCKTEGSLKLSTHAIRCVGYTDNDKTNVKSVYCGNSWSKYWGDQGYFHIKPIMECEFFYGDKNVYTLSSCKS